METICLTPATSNPNAFVSPAGLGQRNRHALPRGPRALLALAGALAILGAASEARAVVLTYTNKTVDGWMGATNWNPNTNWSTGTYRTNIVNTNLRLNIGAVASSSATVTYNGTMGATTLDVSASGGENRAVALGVVSDTASGTLNVSGGTLRCVQEVGAAVVIVGAGASSGYSGTSVLNIAGGTLDASGGEVAVVARGALSSVGTVNVSSGTLVADTISFGNLDAVNGTATLNFTGGNTIARTIRVTAGRQVNKSTAINLNGGQIQAGTNSTTLIDGTGFTVTNAAIVFGVNLLNHPGNTFNIPTNISTTINAVMSGAGGFTKTGGGTLTLVQSNVFSGPIVINQGVLGMLTLPQACSSISAGAGATLRLIDTNNNLVTVPSLLLTNTTVEFNYGMFNGYSSAVLNVPNLALSGTILVNVTGNSFPVTNLTLMTYGVKTGGGAFALGTLPAGASAILIDTGSALLLQVTAPSLQNLVWSGGDGNWQVNGGLDWNGGTAVYLQYPSGTGDLVTFDDSGSGSVNIPGVVKPAGVNVNIASSLYTFNGPGTISGPTGLNVQGTGLLTINTSNDFSGVVTLTGGSGTLGGVLYVNHPNALGSTIGGTVVNGPANTLEIGYPSGNGITVAGETVTINGTGVGGARGVLRGAATATGSNVWAGPVIVGSTGARIGTEDSGNLTVSGTITDNGMGYIPILRPGSGGVLTLTGTNNNWGTRTDFFSSGGGKIVAGANNVFSTNGVLNIGECQVDLNGYAQAAAGLSVNGGVAADAIVVNNGAVPATLTLNLAAGQNFGGGLQDGNSSLSLVVAGGATQTLSGLNNTYTGPTLVSSGAGLAVTLPMNSAVVTVASNASLSVTPANNAWNPATMNLTNMALSFNFGTVTTPPGTVFTTLTLNVSGSNVINIAGVNLPTAPITLIAYTTKAGGGTFNLGTIPSNMQATIVDTGAAIVLNVTFSPMSLTWFGGSSGTWNTNGTYDWNAGNAYYQEYGPAANGLGDMVRFDDTAAVFLVALATNMHPDTVTISNSANAYEFAGPGGIGGPTSLVKSGTNALTLDVANSFSGGTVLNAGTLTFANGSLGSSNITLAGNASLQWAPSNRQDVSSRLFLSSGFAGTNDLQTNDVVWSGGGILGDLTVANSGQLVKLGAGKLTIANGNYFLGNVTRFNAGAVEVAGGSLVLTNSSGTVNLALVLDNTSMVVSGSGSLNVGDRLGVASVDNSVASLTISNGVVTVDNSGSTTTTRGLRVGGNTSARTNITAAVNLDGGTLTTSRVFVGAGSPNSVFAFNGGTLKPSASPFATSFFSGLTHAYVQAGGAIIDSSGLNLTIAQALEHDATVTTDGGLSKLGAGVLTLAGTNTYNGPTVIGSGSLLVNGALGGTAVTVQNGATLGGTGSLGGAVVVNSGGTLFPGAATIGSLAIANALTLSAGATNLVRLSLDGGLTNNDAVIGLTSVAYGGTLVVTNVGSNAIPAGAVFPLFSAASAGTGNFSTLTVLPSGLASFNPATGQLAFLNAAPPLLGYSLAGGAIQFTWAGSFKLQVQTNALNVGLSTNWVDYPGGGASPVSVSVDKAQPSVFFRLVSP